MGTSTDWKQGIGNRLYFSKVRESTFGTPQTLAYYFNPVISGAATRVKVESVNDAGLATGGSFGDYPKKQYPGQLYVPGNTRQFRASPELVGLVSSFLAGNDTAAQLGAVAAYEHAASPVAATALQGAFSMEEHLDSATVDTDHDELMAGMSMTGLTLSGGRETGFVMAQAGWLGSGITGTASTQTEGNLSTDSIHFLNQQTKVGIYTSATSGTSPWDGSDTNQTATVTHPSANWTNWTDISTAVDTWQIALFTNFDEASSRQAGSAAAAGITGTLEPRFSGRGATASIVTKNDGDIQNLIKELRNSGPSSNVEYALQIESVTDLLIATGYYYRMRVVIPLMGFEDTPDGSIENLNTETINLFAKVPDAGTVQYPWAVFFDCAESSVFNA